MTADTVNTAEVLTSDQFYDGDRYQTSVASDCARRSRQIGGRSGRFLGKAVLRPQPQDGSSMAAIAVPSAT